MLTRRTIVGSRHPRTMFAPNLHSYGGDKAKPSVSIHELAALLWRPRP